MPGVPVFGQAVHAPRETAPRAVPVVSVNHVMPRPTKAATAKANNDPKSKRTAGSDQSWRLAMEGLRESTRTDQLPWTPSAAPRADAAVNAPELISPVADTAEGGSDRLTSSNIRSRRMRISAPFFVNSVGRGGAGGRGAGGGGGGGGG